MKMMSEESLHGLMRRGQHKQQQQRSLKSTQGMRPGNSSHLSTTPDLKPPSRKKRKRIALDAPGPLQWQKTRELKEARAREVQGLSEAVADTLEAVWQHLLRAGPRSTVWRKEFAQDSEKHAKELFFRPLRRFADSLRTRLAPMARWEAWLKTEGCHTEDTVDVLLGKFLLSV